MESWGDEEDALFEMDRILYVEDNVVVFEYM